MKRLRWLICPCGRAYRGYLPTCKACRQPDYQIASDLRRNQAEKARDDRRP